MKLQKLYFGGFMKNYLGRYKFMDNKVESRETDE